ncbi:hypothetical protein EVAR_31289_1 [Eumeta japonica]|uniref:Uncharacterized protein n=1 Tax=Eumeta variegata TaxID=151549 RepID=A0A4C1VTL1_EUMVA|nr:hypothetical protein EVAR_31289_1 [Eumeta japonica]
MNKRTNVSKKNIEWWNFEKRKVVGEKKKAWLNLLSPKATHRMQRTDVLKDKLKDAENTTLINARPDCKRERHRVASRVARCDIDPVETKASQCAGAAENKLEPLVKTENLFISVQINSLIKPARQSPDVSSINQRVGGQKDDDAAAPTPTAALRATRRAHQSAARAGMLSRCGVAEEK